MKLSRLIDERFQTQLKKLMASKLPIKTAYKLRDIVRNIDKAIADYDAVRNTIIAKYAKKKDDGTVDVDANGKVQLDQEVLREFAKEIGELTSVDVEIAQITIDELGDKVDPTVDDLIDLDDLIK